ncbi:hypothetical protein HA402_005113 [Bradysia odoriphaga]|nr:hypothetical protein HA402_005113 [Bradysia odoriphaga]
MNSIINKLPIELHLPGYQYCGPGTKLDKRLARGDPGVNQLDQACKEHDIAYSRHKDISNRHKADTVLIDKAWERVKSKDSNLRERVDALLVTNMMKAKVKLGMGVKKTFSKSKNGRKTLTKSKNGKKTSPSLNQAIRSAKKVMKDEKPETVKKSIKLALIAAKKVMKKCKYTKTPRIIPVPKGYQLPGALAGGAAGVAKAVIAANEAKNQLKESQRHNKTMETIAMGGGLFLKPFKSGLGLYLHPNSKN